MRITGNSLTAINTGATGSSFGIQVIGSGNAGTLSNISIAGNDVAPATVSSTKPDTGIAITSSPPGGTGATAWQIANNQALANTTNYIWPTGTTDIGQVLNNIGLAVAVSAVAVGSSPFTYTAGARPTTLYVQNGTTVGVTHGGFQVCPAVSPPNVCTVQLQPGESVIVSYVAAPGINQVQH